MRICMQQVFDMIADIYDETRGLPKHTMDEVVKVMGRELKHCDRVLELGVGTGRFALPLQEHGIDILGIDLSKTMLTKARQKDFRNLVLGDVCTLPFRNTSFDAVISVHVLHLVSDCLKVLCEIKRVGRITLISVLHTSSEFHVRDEYENALARFGYTLEMPGIGEWGLKEIAPPAKRIDIEPFEDIVPIGERLELLKDRKHSFARSTPADIHNAAIEYLKEKYNDKLDVHAKSRVEVVVWDINSLPVSLTMD